MLLRPERLLAAVAICLAAGAPVYASSFPLIINPVFLSSITGDANAVTIESTINAAIGVYQSGLTTLGAQTTVNITFGEMSTGLGQSTVIEYGVSYQAFRDALVSHAMSADDTTVLSVLPNQANNPVNGQTNLYLKSANVKALGLDATAFVHAPASDGTVMINTSATNLSRSGQQVGTQYDLQSVAMHEIDEVLGLGSWLGTGLTNAWPAPEDLFRYAGTGSGGTPCSSTSGRSFTASSAAVSCFSVNGTVGLAQFNQTGTGDYGDWVSGTGTVRVQDAFGTAGSQPNLGVELRALDVIGYNLSTATPEPGTAGMLMAVIGLVGMRRRKSRA